MNKFITLFSIFTFTVFQFVFAQKSLTKLETQVPPPVCYASGKIEKCYIPPPSDILLKSESEKKSDIIVNYSLFPEEAKIAFEFATNIWEQVIQSDIPIHIQADWLTLDESVLGSAGPTSYYTDFENIPHKNRFYPITIVERITKTEITGASAPDITSFFNKKINWYFGTDGNTPDSLYDFVTVALHEIAHGLGFTGFFYISNDLGTYGFNATGEASAFDLLVVKNSNNQLVDTTIFALPSLELKNALTSASLYANSPSATKNGIKPRLYAPTTFNDGSSIYHLNDATYPNDLMTHAIGKAEAVHDPGPLVSGIIADLGWKHMFITLDKPKDMEHAKPITFKVSIESDYKLKTNSLYVIYSTDKFENHIDSLQLIQTESANIFSAILTPEFETEEIQYYIYASDMMNRIFTLPTEAPNELCKVTIGPDTEKPEITHIPIPYFVFFNNDLQISTFADDNLGVDTVFVEYEINGEIQTPFGLNLDSTANYTGYFNFNLEQLKDGDEITYNITARDSSVAQNTKKIPFKEKFYFKVEKIFDPVERYWNNFNQLNNDFVISDFDIYTETSFEDPALHSPHPYLSPEEISSNWNYSTILKHPIILLESATMTFDEVVLVEPGEFQTNFGDDEFWDYVVVEGSKDDGKTWLPLADGYDSRDNSTWKNNYNLNIVGNNSQTEGTKEWFVNREIDLLQSENFVVGDTILIQFRLFSDPFANGWGWAIDNLRIQIPVSSPLTILSPGNIQVYPNPFNDVVNISVQAKKNIALIEIEVYNTFGEKLRTFINKNAIGEISHEINLKNYTNGMYLISVKENGMPLYSRKIIKN
ncbi:MAG: T9SS type A sorting domain-containing protein [Bacteroidetes bacterium]|nr:T9SS type A sorting domain-containing protein [Bacteroidota bacterium]